MSNNKDRGFFLSPTAFDKIQEARTTSEGKNLSLEQIAETAGLSYSTVQRALTPQRVERLSLIRIGEALNVQLSGKDFIKKPPVNYQGTSSTKSKQLMSKDRDLLLKILGDLQQQADKETDQATKQKLLDDVAELKERIAEMD